MIWTGPTPVRSVFGNLWGDYAVLLLGGLLIGLPFYGVALLILHNATVLILKFPLIFCVVVPALFLTAALYAFPPQRWGGIFWVALIPMSALFAGAIFYVWHWWSPFTPRIIQTDPLPESPLT
jgi:hypothetical protein